MNKQDERPEITQQSNRLNRQGELLIEAIEQKSPDLQLGIEIYVRRFGLDESQSSVKELAQEIFQETVITALQNVAKYDPDRPAHPWLLGIAINHIRRLLRTKSHENQHVTPVAETPQVRQAMQQLDTETIPESEMFDWLYQAASSSPPLEEILALVKGSDQELLRLAFEEGLSGKELAAKLGTSPGAARVRLHRVIRQLREAYFQSG